MMIKENCNLESQEELLRVENLEIAYKTDKDTVQAVNNINFSLKRQHTLGLVGETGAGKTTTALGIMGLLPDRTGKVLDGKIIFKNINLLEVPEKEMETIRGNLISMIFQDPMTSLNPVINIGDQVAEAWQLHNKAKISKEEINDRVDEILSLVGIDSSRKKEYPHQFSGGMKQRVVIAISLACNPEIIIADEPTTALDVTIQAQVLAMLEDLKQKMGTAMIMITHDLGIVAETCDEVAIMYAGEIVEIGSVEEIFESKNHHPYTSGLFNAIPDLHLESKLLTPIEGMMPDPTNLPGGCKFHPRCPHKTTICELEQPPVYGKGNHLIQCHLYSREDSHE